MKKEYKQNFITAGKLAKEVREYGKGLIIKGASYADVILKVREKIFSLGAIPAFPPQIALNDVAAHFLPHPNKTIIFQDDVVKLDVGVCYEGAIGDCAVTVDLSGKHQGLIDAAEEALLNAEKIIKVGTPTREIGRIIAATIEKRGYQPVRNLAGHGLAEYKVHTFPQIPNCDDRSSNTIKAGMTFAIEPFATTGKGLIYEEGEPTIFSFVAVRPLKDEKAQALVKKIQTLKGLPFSLEDLISEEFPVGALEVLIEELLKARAIRGYAPLLEEEKGMVAQAENSVLVDEKGVVTITTR